MSELDKPIAELPDSMTGVNMDKTDPIADYMVIEQPDGTKRIIPWALADTFLKQNVLTGFTAGANLTINATDTEWTALRKLQGQINALAAAARRRDSFTPTSGQTSFTLTGSISLTAKPIVFVNGAEQEQGVDYTASGNTLTWLDDDFTLDSNDTLTIYY